MYIFFTSSPFAIWSPVIIFIVIKTVSSQEFIIVFLLKAMLAKNNTIFLIAVHTPFAILSVT